MKPNLIEEYKLLASTCAQTDYTDKLSVKIRNAAVDRMYEIVETIGYEKCDETPEQFVALLSINNDGVNLWSAIHILERLPVESQTERKALSIIQKASKGQGSKAMGYKYWLDDYNKNRESKVDKK